MEQTTVGYTVIPSVLSVDHFLALGDLFYEKILRFSMIRKRSKVSLRDTLKWVSLAQTAS